MRPRMLSWMLAPVRIHYISVSVARFIRLFCTGSVRLMKSGSGFYLQNGKKPGAKAMEIHCATDAERDMWSAALSGKHKLL